MSESASGYLLKKIDSKKQALEAATDDKTRNILSLEICGHYSAAVQEEMGVRNYEQAEEIIPVWHKFLGTLGSLPDQIVVAMLFVQYHSKLGDLNSQIAFEAYQLESNFIDAASHYYRAEHQYEQAKKYFNKMEEHNAANPNPKLLADTIASQGIFLERGVADIQGMHALIEGELKLEAGNYTTAAEFLDKAIADLSRADTLAKDERQNWLEEAPSPTFTNFARALRYRTETETQLISGDLVKAADAEQLRAQALRDSSREHSISELPSSEYFRLRTKRDQMLAEQRARFLALAAGEKKHVSPFHRYIFPALAFAGIGVLVYLARDMEVMQNPAVFIFVLLFSMIIAAISTGLTSYKDGQRTLVALARAAKEADKEE